MEEVFRALRQDILNHTASSGRDSRKRAATLLALGKGTGRTRRLPTLQLLIEKSDMQHPSVGGTQLCGPQSLLGGNQ